MGNIQGIRVARGATSISHLFFADDTFIFCNATPIEARETKNIVEDYCDI